MPAPPSERDDTADDTRRRLLDGLAVSIRERGYRETKVADIARAARTSLRTFYQHFDGKQECYLELIRASNGRMIEMIHRATDPSAPWQTQIEQGVWAWLETAFSEPDLTVSLIRETPALGEQGRAVQRDMLDAFVALIDSITDSSVMQAAGIKPSRPYALMMLGGLRELLATTVEEGLDVDEAIEVAITTTTALAGAIRAPE